MFMTGDITDEVGNILDQLKAVPKVVKRVESMNLTKENLEEFIMKHTSELIENSTATVNNMSDYVNAAPNAEDVLAFSELVKASASAIETLNKMLIANKKNNTLIKIKEMDVESRKKEIDTVVGAKLLMSREELMKQFFNELSTPTIDMTPVHDEPKQLN